MRTGLPSLLLALATALPLVPAHAQSVWLSPAPPAALRIVRETAQFGTAAAHLANETAWVNTLRSKKVPISYVGTVAASGAPQFWFIGGAPSFAALGGLDAIYQGNKSLLKQLDTLMAREAKYVIDVQTTLLAYRADLSHRPMFIAPETRHFWVTILQVRPGQDEAFGALMGAFIKAYDAAQLPTPWVTYQLMAGGDAPAYYLFMPMETYAALDEDLQNMKALGPQLSAVPDLSARMAGAVSRMESHVLTISPQISYVPKEFAEEDKAFWEVK